MTKKKWIFCTETTYLKILKEKDQLQASQPRHDSDYLARLATFFSNNCSMRGSSFKQIKLSELHESLEKNRKLHIRIFFASFSQIQLQQLFTGKESIVLESLPAVVVLRYFTAYERKICVQKDNKTIILTM